MAFKDYKDTPLLPFVLPIIPVGAPLSKKSKLKPENLGKIPGAWDYDTKGWTGYVEFTRTRATAKMMDVYDAWFRDSGYKDTPIVGVLGEAWPAIDIDVEDEKVVEIVENAIDFWCGGVTLKRIRSNSKRALFMFKWKEGEEPAKKRKHRFYLPGDPKRTEAGEPIRPSEIEFLGRGQQYLIEGMHKSGVYYEWLLGLTPSNSHELIKEIDAATWQLIYDTIRGHLESYGADFDIPNVAGGTRGSGTSTAAAAAIGSEHFDRAPSLEDLANLLKAFPATHPELADRDEWVTFLRAIKAACGGDGQFYEDVVVPWNIQFPGLEREYLDERWESFHDSSMGWSYLVSVAQGDAPEFVASLFPELDLSGLEDDVEDGELASEGNKVKLNLDDRTLAAHFVEAYALKDWCVQTRMGEKPKWMRFVKGVWQPDQLSILDDIGQVLERVSDQVVHDPSSNAKRREAGMRLRGVAKVRTVATAIQAKRRMHVPVEKFDRHPWLMGCPGGYVDEDNKLRDPDPGLFISRSLPFAPVFGQPTPLWDQQLMTVAEGSDATFEAIMRVFGCTMSGTGQEQKLWFFEGQGGVGVTTLLEAFVACCGLTNGYGKVVSHKAFVKGNAERFLPADLAGVWAAVVSEIVKSEEWAMSTLKQATSSGTMPIEEKGFQGRMVPITWQLLFQGNEIPRPHTLDRAFMQRLIVVPVRGTSIRDTAKDVKGFSKLIYQAEGPAILGKLLEARLRYRRESLTVPTHWRRRTDEYFSSMDADGLWMEDRIDWHQNAKTRTMELFEDRRTWGQETGHTGNIGAINNWVNKLKEHSEIRRRGIIFKREPFENSPNKVGVAIGMRLVTGSGSHNAWTTTANF